MRYMITILCFGFLCLPAQANVLVADLSKDHISIRSDFSGETLLLFGAVNETPMGAVRDIVVVLRGPSGRFTLRKKTRQAGIWMNSEAYHIGGLPAFYAVVSTAPLARIVPAPLRATHKIGIHSLHANIASAPTANPESNGVDELTQAFVRLRQAQGLYSESESGVKIIGARLFRAELNLPSGMPIGTYVIEFFAFQDGQLVGYQTGELPVDTVGAGNFMYKAAYNTPLLYGLGGIVLATLMGWAAALIFQRRW